MSCCVAQDGTRSDYTTWEREWDAQKHIIDVQMDSIGQALKVEKNADLTLSREAIEQAVKKLDDIYSRVVRNRPKEIPVSMANRCFTWGVWSVNTLFGFTGIGTLAEVAISDEESPNAKWVGMGLVVVGQVIGSVAGWWLNSVNSDEERRRIAAKIESQKDVIGRTMGELQLISSNRRDSVMSHWGGIKEHLPELVAAAKSGDVKVEIGDGKE